MPEELNLSLIRSQFPALAGRWTFLDNAGGTQTALQVGKRLNEYLYQTNVQLGAGYEISRLAGQKLLDARSLLADFIHAPDPSEIILGPSTTQLLQNFSRSMARYFMAGDEVIVTNCDHEANIGPWINMQNAGINIKVWKIRKETLRLHLEDLDKLMTSRTRLVAFTHISNILGTINPVRDFVKFIHERGAWACVDGVAATPHRLPDMQLLDADFYVFSLYKVFGPHYSLLYGKRKILEQLPGIGHYFIPEDDIPYKFQPGNVNFELTSSLIGVMDYFRDMAQAHGIADHGIQGLASSFYDKISIHEENLAARLIDFLKQRKGVKIIGENGADRFTRVPTISFISEGKNSKEIVDRVDPHFIGIRYGDFYARRLIESLGLDHCDGVVRVSMVHYNTPEEIEKLLVLIDSIL
jgi:cysteine desulfurase family protein (TIGR01976 family)